MGSEKVTKDIFKSCLNLLRKNKKLLFFPILEVSFFLISFALFTLIVNTIVSTNIPGNHIRVYISILLLGYVYILYFFSIFFEGALTVSIFQSIDKKGVNIQEALKIVTKKIDKIVIWGFVSTFFFILYSFIKKNNIIERLFGGFLTLSWRLLTLFVIPIMIFQDVNMISSIKQSGTFFKHSYGENVVAQIKLFFLLLPYIFLSALILMIGYKTDSNLISIPLIIMGAVGLGIVIVLGRIIHIIIKTVLFVYVSRGKIANGFMKSTLVNSFKTKS